MRTLDLSPLTAWRNAASASRSLWAGAHRTSVLRLVYKMVACEQEVWKQMKQADRTTRINTLIYLDLFSLLPEQNLLSLFISTQRDCTVQNINLKHTSIIHLFNKAFIEHLLCARHWPGHQWTFRYRFPQHPFLLYIFISTIFTLAWISVTDTKTHHFKINSQCVFTLMLIYLV